MEIKCARTNQIVYRTAQFLSAFACVPFHSAFHWNPARHNPLGFSCPFPQAAPVLGLPHCRAAPPAPSIGPLIIHFREFHLLFKATVKVFALFSAQFQ